MNHAKFLRNSAMDAKNYFTARLLLLLESRALYGDSTYDAAITSFIAVYFGDFEAHPSDFRPAFIMNDIDRFWRTLCLNYENKRSHATDEDKLKHCLKDMKLGFSRMLTCQSGKIDIASAYALNGTVTPEDVIEMMQHTRADNDVKRAVLKAGVFCIHDMEVHVVGIFLFGTFLNACLDALIRDVNSSDNATLCPRNS